MKSWRPSESARRFKLPLHWQLTTRIHDWDLVPGKRQEWTRTDDLDSDIDPYKYGWDPSHRMTRIPDSESEGVDRFSRTDSEPGT